MVSTKTHERGIFWGVGTGVYKFWLNLRRFKIQEKISSYSGKSSILLEDQFVNCWFSSPLLWSNIIILSCKAEPRHFSLAVDFAVKTKFKTEYQRRRSLWSPVSSPARELDPGLDISLISFQFSCARNIIICKYQSPNEDQQAWQLV